MVARFTDTLTAPAGRPTPWAPGGAVAITWTILAAVQRFALVLDRSAALAGLLLAEEKAGATWWADAAVLDDQLGVVSFDDIATADVPLITITDDGDRAAVRSVVADLQPGDAGTLGAGPEAGLAAGGAVLAAGPPAANQVLVLVTDGARIAGAGPTATLLTLGAARIRVYLVAVGPFDDAASLEDTLRTTGGELFPVDPRLPAEDQAFRVRTALQQISQIARDNLGFVTFEPGNVEPGAALERAVLVEEGSERALFAVSWKEPGPLELTLFRPSRPPPDDTPTVVTAGDPDVRLIAGTGPYAAFEVMEPRAGMWRAVISVGPGAPGPVEHVFFATSQHLGLTGALAPAERRHRVGDAVLLHLQVYLGHPLTGLAVEGRALLPDGRDVLLPFTDDGDPDTGDAIAEDGLYSAVLRDTVDPGVYTVVVQVASDGSSARQGTGGETPDPAGIFSVEFAPAFRRRFETTFVIES